jgi:hypothetical protein
LRSSHVPHRRSQYLFLAEELGMYSKAARLANQGELIHMELGQPVHHTPQHIKAPKRFTAEKTRASL